MTQAPRRARLAHWDLQGPTADRGAGSLQNWAKKCEQEGNTGALGDVRWDLALGTREEAQDGCLRRMTPIPAACLYVVGIPSSLEPASAGASWV